MLMAMHENSSGQSLWFARFEGGRRLENIITHERRAILITEAFVSQGNDSLKVCTGSSHISKLVKLAISSLHFDRVRQNQAVDGLVGTH